MLARRVHHVSFAVRDLARAREFYEGILGLRSIARPDLGLPGVWYAAGEGEIHLIQAPAGASVGAPPTRQRFSPGSDCPGLSEERQAHSEPASAGNRS